MLIDYHVSHRFGTLTHKAKHYNHPDTILGAITHFACSGKLISGLWLVSPAPLLA